MLLREKVWFPSKRQVSGRKSQDMSSLPSSNYRYLRQTFPSGELLLVIIDEFSRFPEVEIINSTSAKTVIPKLDDIFFRQGVPCVLKTDNGPPFNSSEFEQFAKYLGFKHRRVTPYWPKANEEAERFMRTLGKAIRTAYIENKNRKQALYEILRQYRATPHSTTTISPAEALNNRKLKIPLPSFVNITPTKDSWFITPTRPWKERVDEGRCWQTTTFKDQRPESRWYSPYSPTEKKQTIPAVWSQRFHSRSS